MRIRQGSTQRVRTGLAGAAALACIAGTPAAAGAAGAATHPAGAAGQRHICRSNNGHEQRAHKLSAAIQKALGGRTWGLGLRVDDPHLGIECYLNASTHFDSASTVKAIILAALLRMANERHRSLTTTEQNEAWLMITQSDNNAATYLWNDVGMGNLQHFLNLAGMRHTYLGQNGYWGTTQETAHDETLLLRRLVKHNKVLTNADRRYELRLMADVIPSQRWGVPAGAPAGFRVHVKNGWLPISSGWIINSIGAFTRRGRTYSIVVLTDGNTSMGSGIATIERAAVVIHRILNPGAKAVVPRSTPSPAWDVPDEHLPASVLSGNQ